MKLPHEALQHGMESVTAGLLVGFRLLKFDHDRVARPMDDQREVGRAEAVGPRRAAAMRAAACWVMSTRTFGRGRERRQGMIDSEFGPDPFQELGLLLNSPDQQDERGA